MRPHPILLAAAALVAFASNSLSDKPKPGGDQFVQFDLYAVPEAEAARLWNDPAFFTNGSEARKWAESLADAGRAKRFDRALLRVPISQRDQNARDDGDPFALPEPALRAGRSAAMTEKIYPVEFEPDPAGGLPVPSAFETRELGTAFTAEVWQSDGGHFLGFEIENTEYLGEAVLMFKMVDGKRQPSITQPRFFAMRLKGAARVPQGGSAFLGMLTPSAESKAVGKDMRLLAFATVRDAEAKGEHGDAGDAGAASAICVIKVAEIPAAALPDIAGGIDVFVAATEAAVAKHGGKWTGISAVAAAGQSAASVSVEEFPFWDDFPHQVSATDPAPDKPHPDVPGEIMTLALPTRFTLNLPDKPGDSARAELLIQKIAGWHSRRAADPDAKDPISAFQKVEGALLPSKAGRWQPIGTAPVNSAEGERRVLVVMAYCAGR